MPACNRQAELDRDRATARAAADAHAIATLQSQLATDALRSKILAEANARMVGDLASPHSDDPRPEDAAAALQAALAKACLLSLHLLLTKLDKWSETSVICGLSQAGINGASPCGGPAPCLGILLRGASKVVRGPCSLQIVPA